MPNHLSVSVGSVSSLFDKNGGSVNAFFFVFFVCFLCVCCFVVVFIETFVSFNRFGLTKRWQRIRVSIFFYQNICQYQSVQCLRDGTGKVQDTRRWTVGGGGGV